MNEIRIIDNFLSIEECEYLVRTADHLHDNINPEGARLEAAAGRQQYISIYNSGIASATNPEERKQFSFPWFDHFKNKLESLDNTCMLSWANLSRWPVGTSQPIHLDGHRDNTVFTSVVYLTSDCLGGETFFSCGTRVVPKQGRVICFPGNLIEHGVNPIISGTRYSLASWYHKK